DGGSPVHNDNPELHVNVTNTERTVRDKQDSRTVVGVDVTEDNVALTARSETGIEDTLVIEFPEIKFERHRYFTMRKRVQNAGKESIHDTLEGREERFVRDRLHKVSRHIVEWSQQFEKSCIVFEALKEMRDSTDYGTRMNRRLHHLPSRALQYYTSYKAAFAGISTGWIDPYETTQQCPMCGHAERAHRRGSPNLVTYSTSSGLISSSSKACLAMERMWASSAPSTMRKQRTFS
uniref:transposase n=1 Tax=Halorientalis sp. TaxID=1931229 RepID=UPI0032C22C97